MRLLPAAVRPLYCSVATTDLRDQSHKNREASRRQGSRGRLALAKFAFAAVQASNSWANDILYLRLIAARVLVEGEIGLSCTSKALKLPRPYCPKAWQNIPAA